MTTAKEKPLCSWCETRHNPGENRMCDNPDEIARDREVARLARAARKTACEVKHRRNLTDEALRGTRAHALALYEEGLALSNQGDAERALWAAIDSEDAR